MNSKSIIFCIFLVLVGCKTTTPDLANEGSESLAAAASREMNSGQYTLAERRIDRLSQIASEKDSNLLIGNSFFLRAQLEKLKGNIDRAYSLLDIAEEKYSTIEHYLGLATVQAERATLFASQYKDSDACEMLELALKNYRSGIAENPNQGIPVFGNLESFEEKITRYMTELNCIDGEQVQAGNDR